MTDKTEIAPATEREELRDRVRSRMAAEGIPIGTDDPTLLALGASPLHMDMSQAFDAASETAIGLPIRAVTQEHEHRDGEPGDCLRAAVASIFGVPVKDVPHFARYGEGCEPPDKHGWWWAYVGYCATLEPAYELLQFPAGSPPPPTETIDDLYGCYIATGKSPRGDWNHCVVGRGGQTIWDPHPDRSGIDGEPIEYEAFVRCKVGVSKVRLAHQMLPTERDSTPHREPDRDAPDVPDSGGLGRVG